MFHFILLCGGRGERLWPKSRECYPKQFLITPTNLSLFQMTLNRINKLITNNEYLEADITIIGNTSYQHVLEDQISKLILNVPIKLVLEPEGRDSAPAICISSLLYNREDYTYILTCDHLLDEIEFEKKILESILHIEENIIIFGVKPTHPETGFGYIKVKDTQTLEFKEKPTHEVATQYLQSGDYLWNSGMFAFKNNLMIQCFETFQPEMITLCKLALQSKTKKVIKLTDDFKRCTKISFDYAIMENVVSSKNRSININILTLHFNGQWSDIGNYKAKWENFPQDENHNVLHGNIQVLNTTNCYIDSPNHHVSTIGVNNLAIVQTDDALLVSSLDECINVKNVVNALKGTKNDCLLKEHKLMFRPWGWYKNVEGHDHNGFKMKRIAVYPGKRLSLQSHNNREEHWVIVKGSGIVQLGQNFIKVKKGNHVHIPVQVLHRVENTGEDLLEFTETQIGEYLGEDDIIRYEDDFGRVNK